MKRSRKSSSSDGSSEDELAYDRKVAVEDNFLKIISSMMYTFGDAREPLKESVKIMKIIVREQLNILLLEAEKAARLRGSREISHAEILFLMRKNKEKIKQLVECIKVLDSKQYLSWCVKPEEGDSFSNKKNVKKCIAFLASIEDCKEFTSMFKDENFTLPPYYKQRLERRMAMIELMKINEYKEFAEALRKSFGQNSIQFQRWLLQDKVTKFPLTKLALVMIGFLARETVGVICDKALLIKADKLKGPNCDYCSSNPLDLLYASNSNLGTQLTKHNSKDLDFPINISEREVDILSNIKDGATGLDSNISTHQENSTCFITPLDYIGSGKSQINEETCPYRELQGNASSCSNSYVASAFQYQSQSFQEAGTSGLQMGHQENKYCVSTEDVSDYESARNDSLHEKWETVANKLTSKYHCLHGPSKKFLSREAITPEEIKEAYQQLNEPSALPFFFSR